MSEEEERYIQPATKLQKEERIAELSEAIESEKSLIQQLNINISELQADILRFQNANKLFQYLKPSTIPEHTITSEDDAAAEFNEEHENILKEKRNLIPPLRAEVATLEENQATSEDRLTTLRAEYDDSQNSIIEYQEKIRFSNSECVRSTRELNYVNDQITERQNEVRMMEDLKREAQIALSSLVERANDADGLGGGRLDTEKAILSLQNELRAVEAEIAEVTNRIEGFMQEDKEDIAEKENAKLAHDSAVNWEKEKDELKREWHDLLQQIQQKKSNLKTTEPKSSNNTWATTRVIPLVKKWRGKKVSNVSVPENATIESMFTKLDEVKEEKEKSQKVSEQEIAELIVNNARLQDEVTRRRKALERTVTQFHSDENTTRKKIEDVGNKATKEEEKLLKQIEATKIKMAQRQLRTTTTTTTTGGMTQNSPAKNGAQAKSPTKAATPLKSPKKL